MTQGSEQAPPEPLDAAILFAPVGSLVPIALKAVCIPAGSCGRFFNTVDLVNRLEAEGRSGRQGRLAAYLTRLDFIILDERAYLDHRHDQSRLR